MATFSFTVQHWVLEYSLHFMFLFTFFSLNCSKQVNAFEQMTVSPPTGQSRQTMDLAVSLCCGQQGAEGPGLSNLGTCILAKIKL